MIAVRSIRRSPLAASLATGVLVASAFLTMNGAGAASNLPADKLTVSGSKTEVTAPSGVMTLFTAQMKTSTPADLRFLVTAECTILSNITNAGTSSTSSYTTNVDVWVEVDGRPVPVVPSATTTGASSGGGGTDDGSVVFCNREFARKAMFDSQNESISDVERTSQVGAFAWTALNVGNGIHDIVVKARFTNDNTGDAMSHGVIGKRTLTVDTTNYFISQPTVA